eukprot:UN02030
MSWFNLISMNNIIKWFIYCEFNQIIKCYLIINQFFGQPAISQVKKYTNNCLKCCKNV